MSRNRKKSGKWIFPTVIGSLLLIAIILGSFSGQPAESIADCSEDVEEQYCYLVSGKHKVEDNVLYIINDNEGDEFFLIYRDGINVILIDRSGKMPVHATHTITSLDDWVMATGDYQIGRFSYEEGGLFVDFYRLPEHPPGEAVDPFNPQDFWEIVGEELDF